jgi:prevent-host-death family protein
MSTYSVAEAKNRLPSLINKAIAGEEVVITRHGKPVAELRPPRVPVKPRDPAAFHRLIAARDKMPPIPITSVELLNQMYEEDRD